MAETQDAGKWEVRGCQTVRWVGLEQKRTECPSKQGKV